MLCLHRTKKPHGVTEILITLEKVAYKLLQLTDSRTKISVTENYRLYNLKSVFVQISEIKRILWRFLKSAYKSSSS